MTTAWRIASIFLAGSLSVVAAGAWMMRTAFLQERVPREVLSTRKILTRMGGSQGLVIRQQTLSEIFGRLELEKTARTSDAATFSQRLEGVFAELDLAITSSSEWLAVPEFKVAGAAAFERTFSGSGAFDVLLDAVHTIESWPDQARVRALSVAFEAPGTVVFTLEVTAVRLVAEEED